MFNLMVMESRVGQRGPVAAIEIAEMAGKVIGFWDERKRRASQSRAEWDEKDAMSQAKRRRKKQKRSKSPSNKDGDLRA